MAACIRQHHPQYSNETVHQVRRAGVGDGVAAEEGVAAGEGVAGGGAGAVD